MGGGPSTRGDVSRLLTAGMCAAMVLLILGSAAAAARGGQAPAAPPPPTPALARVAAPDPLPPPDPPTTRAPRPEKAAVPKPAKAPVTTTTVPVTTTVTAPPSPPPPPPPAIPEGKGMWVWKPQLSDGGSAKTIVARAKAVGLSHIFVRTGSSWDGFDGGAFLEQLLPVAHAHGLKVYAWDFPKLEKAGDDVGRALDAINFTAHGGHHVDGFAADIETPSEGTRLSLQAVQIYGSVLRGMVGPSKWL